MILFVGDRPNPKKNRDRDTAFVGTTSYKVLLEWIYRMDIDVSRVVMRNAFDLSGDRTLLDYELDAWQDGRVITLGSAPADRLRDYNDFVKPLQFFKLPHPSGLNRELNDKKKLSESLAKCRAWVYKQD